MRISDLSSDVCSSDLVFGQLKTIALLAWVFFMGAIGFALVPFSGNALVLGAIAFFFGLGMGIGIPLTVILMFSRDRKSVVEGKSWSVRVDLGGRRIIIKKKTYHTQK